MPVIELDMLIALVNRADKLHEVASKLFSLIVRGKLKGVAIASSACLEYELVLRSRGYPEREVKRDLPAFRSMENLGEAPLTINTLAKASEIRERYGLSFF